MENKKRASFKRHMPRLADLRSKIEPSRVWNLPDELKKNLLLLNVSSTTGKNSLVDVYLHCCITLTALLYYPIKQNPSPPQTIRNPEDTLRPVSNLACSTRPKSVLKWIRASRTIATAPWKPNQAADYINERPSNSFLNEKCRQLHSRSHYYC